MTPLKNTLLAGASTAALLVATVAANAQTTTETPLATDALGGQVVVEQEDATVDVVVPDPDVNVTQGAPIVTVDQPQPVITVVVPEPTVRVQQQAPIITIEQAQPQVTVFIPEPTVTVVVPQPEVDVTTGEPIIDLDQPAPIVKFIRPEPMITIEEAEPRITFENAEPNVNIAEADAAIIDVNQEEAEVNIEQSAVDSDVMVETADAEVNIVGEDGAQVDIVQEQARIVMEDYKPDAEGRMEESDRMRYETEVANLPIFNLRGEELVGRSVATETGEDVGEIDFVGKRGDTLVAIIGVGGFLGMGENEVAIALEKLIMTDDEVILPGFTQERLESMPEFNEAEVRLLDPGLRLAEQIGLD